MKQSTKYGIAVLLVLGAALFFGSIASAGSITLTCTAPTLNEDDTPLTDLAGYRFYHGTQQGGPYPNMDERNASECSYVIDDLSPATYYVVATAVNESGVESRFSNEVTKVVAGSSPNPPLNLVVEAGNLTAYGLSQTRNVIVAFPVGTVPEGTECDSSMKFNDKYVVPYEAVIFVSETSARPEVIFAQCGAV